ncbi:MAG: hypothetical protein ACLTF5_04635 [Butyricicoccus sp.]
MRKLKNYKPTRFMAETSHYSKQMADFAVMFIEQLTHTKGTWAGSLNSSTAGTDHPRPVCVRKPNGYRQFNTPISNSEMGKSGWLPLSPCCCGDGEGAEVPVALQIHRPPSFDVAAI